MLTLSRKRNEVIRIGDDIKVVVYKIEGNRVTIAIEAPREVQIHRGEIYDKIHNQEDFQKGTENVRIEDEHSST